MWGQSPEHRVGIGGQEIPTARQGVSRNDLRTRTWTRKRLVPGRGCDHHPIRRHCRSTVRPKKRGNRIRPEYGRPPARRWRADASHSSVPRPRHEIHPDLCPNRIIPPLSIPPPYPSISLPLPPPRPWVRMADRAGPRKRPASPVFPGAMRRSQGQERHHGTATG